MFTTKAWQDHLAGGTPLNAAGLIDMESRLGAYTDLLRASIPPWQKRTCVFESIPRYTPTLSGGSVVPGRRFLHYFTADCDDTLTQLAIYTGGTLASGISAARMALYTVAGNGDLTMACRTSNDNTIGNAINVEHPRTLDTTGGFPASYQLVVGQRYAGAFYITAAPTMPTLYSSQVAAALCALAPRISGYDNGTGTDLNTSIPAANVAANPTFFYMAGLA